MFAQRETSWTHVHWEEPEEGWVKLNLDGVNNVTSVTGCGGIIRNIKG